jgi:micrococcal nuclease
VEQHDRYGRLLAYVYRRADGLFVNAELLRRGYAQLLTIPPNVAHTDELASIARQAREGSQGLWAACPLLPDGRVAPASSSGPNGSG